MALNQLSVFAAVLLISSPFVAPAESGALSDSQVQAIRGLIQAKMAEYRIPGSTFAVGLGGHQIWAEGFGLADVENDVSAKVDTEYRSASIGKSMTATAAMQLVDQGKLDLDAPIQKYCPKFPEKPSPIMVRDLISMTSGIRHYEGANLQNELYNTHHYDHVSDALDIFKNDPLKQKPGSDFLYSSWGYVVLGCVIEGASGEDYLKHMQKAIFDPAGMRYTRDDDPRAIIPNRARGYVIEGGILKNSIWVDMSSKMPAGGFITTAPDLVRFMDAWMAGELISAKSMTQMITPYRAHTGTIDQFGMGWFLDDYHGLRAALFGGGTPQVAGVIFFIPEKKLAIAGIFNLEDVPGNERIAIAEGIADVILGYKQPNPDHWKPN